MSLDGKARLELDAAIAQRLSTAIELFSPTDKQELEELLIERRIALVSMAAAHKYSGRPDLALIYWNRAQQLRL